MAYTFLDIAYDVLSAEPQPLIYQEIWAKAVAKGFHNKLKKIGKTPDRSIGSRLYSDVRDNKEQSRFVKVGSDPARFFLKDRQSEVSDKSISQLEKVEEKKARDAAPKYKERALHPVLSFYVNSNLAFNRGRPVYTKTIMHEKALKPGLNEWVYPDMVGFYSPITDWKSEVIELNKILDNNSILLYSFELKIVLNKGNYRAAYFQAVSNSSWAHYGYLVSPEISDEPNFRAEIERLVASFGIGIIRLDLDDIDSSEAIYPARKNDSLDWETINKLCNQNVDFRDFAKNVRDDFSVKNHHPEQYDRVCGLEEIEQYVTKDLKPKS